jgi:hypothetical protein
VQDRPGKACGGGEPGIGVRGLRSPHSRYSSACCGRMGSATSASGARSGGSTDA